MKIDFWSLAIVIGLFLMGTGRAQEKTVTPDLGKISDGKTWRLVNAEAQFGQEAGKQFVRLQAKGGDPGKVETAGLALVEGLTFREGTIEVDLQGRNVRQHSFLGVTFHATDGTTFETVYFRPFNFNADPPFRSRVVQYTSLPEHSWQKLREETPGVYEHAVNPVPDPDGWFHARIEVTAKTVRAFVNDAQEPSLVVDRLTERETGGVGLWVGVFDGTFANLRITPK